MDHKDQNEYGQADECRIDADDEYAYASLCCCDLEEWATDIDEADARIDKEPQDACCC